MKTATLPPKIRDQKRVRQSSVKTPVVKLHRAPVLFAGYREAVLLTFLLALAGFLLEFATNGRGITLPPWPVNFYLLIGFALTLVMMALASRENGIIAWLSSIPVAICSIAMMGVLALVAGVLPQDAEFGGALMQRFGINHLFRSWPFALSIFFLLTNLGITTVRKSFPFRLHHLRFFLNHAGLWIVISAGTIGSSDLQRLQIYVNEGESVNHAYDAARQPHRMPFEIKLNDFRMELHPPKMAFVNQHTGHLLQDKSDALQPVEIGSALEMHGWRVEVLQFLPNAKWTGKTLETSKATGAPPAALVRASNIYSQESKTGWISSGNSFHKAKYFPVADALVAMTKPQPKRFQSDVVLSEGDVQRQELLEVNKPISIAGWKLYQQSYDNRLEQWSKLSIIEAVRDPWLPAVYFGIALMLVGTLQILWSGFKISGVYES